MAKQNDQPEEISHILAKTLSTHGHGFHYAVLRRSKELFEQEKSYWVLQAAEFPVSAGDKVTHIDFVCSSRRRLTYLVAECKRADPARARWCFVRAPFTWRAPRPNDAVFEEVTYRPRKFQARACLVQANRPVYHLGLELKTGMKGDGRDRTQAINDATTQVLRGTSGLINQVCVDKGPTHEPAALSRFLPVIFTTAELWVSDTDLSEAELETGKVDLGRAQQVQWLWFNHNQTPALQHGLTRHEVSEDLSAALRHQFTRTIAIVSPSGIDEFLSHQHHDFDAWVSDY